MAFPHRGYGEEGPRSTAAHKGRDLSSEGQDGSQEGPQEEIWQWLQQCWPKGAATGALLASKSHCPAQRPACQAWSSPHPCYESQKWERHLSRADED